MSIRSALILSRKPATSFAVVGAFWGSFAASLPAFKDQISASDAQFGLLLLGTSIGLGTTMLLAPRFDSIFKERSMMLAAIALGTAGFLPTLVTTPAFFLIAMVFVGLASGLLDVIMNARVSELETQHNRSLMNANHGMFSIAYAVSAVFAGLSREFEVALPIHFSILAVVTFFLASLTRIQVTSVSEEEKLNQSFPWKIVLICAAVVLIAFMTEAAVESWSALHVERTLGGRAAEGALGPAMLGLTMAFGRFGGHLISDRFDDLSVIFGGAVLAVSGAFIAASAPTPIVAYLGFGVVGLGVSVIGPIGLSLVGQLVPPEIRTIAISRAAVVGFAGFFIAPAMMGLVSEAFGLRVAFGVLGFFVTVLFVLIPVVRRIQTSSRY